MSSRGLIRFQCPHCGRRLAAKPQNAGWSIPCPKCHESLRVPALGSTGPAPTPTPATAPPRRPAKRSPAPEVPAAERERDPAADALFQDEVPVICHVCQTRMYAPASKIGEQIRCPDCLVYTVVKSAPSRRSSRHPLDLDAPESGSAGSDTGDLDEYRLQDWEVPWKASDEKLLPISCEVCHTRMYAHEHDVGEFLVCPDCGRLNQVPVPKKKPETIQRQQEFPELDLDMGAEDTVPNEVRKAHAHELLSHAEEELKQREEAIPEMPDHPMIEGIYSFLFQRQIMLLWLSVAGGCVLISYLLQMIISMNDMRALVPGLLMLSVGGTCLLGFVATQLISILYNTSEGYNQIVHAPENSFTDWLLDAWVLFAAFGYSNFPSFLLFKFEVPPAIAWPISVTASFILFPIFLVSMLEGGSRLVPFSDEVWNSLTNSFGAWLAFFFQALLLCGAIAGIAYGILVTHHVIWNMVLVTVAGPLVAGALILYFRLLGRVVLSSGSLEGPRDDRHKDDADLDDDAALAESRNIVAP